MSSPDHKEPVAKPEVQQTSDSVAGSTKAAKTLFSMDLLAKHDGHSAKGTPGLPSMSIVHADGETATSSRDRAPLEHLLSSGLAPWTPAAGKIADAPHKQEHVFKPFKLPNGQMENTGYVPDSPDQIKQLTGEKLGLWKPEGSAGNAHPTGDLTKWTHAPGAADTASADNSHGDTRRAPLSAAGSPRDAVAPLVQQVGDSVPPSEPSQIIINSGAGSRAQLFNRGPRIEHTATVPPASAPVEVLPAAPSAPSADTPQPQPYDGPGSRARLFRNQPRN
jgi:hypothetical protein